MLSPIQEVQYLFFVLLPKFLTLDVKSEHHAKIRRCQLFVLDGVANVEIHAVFRGGGRRGRRLADFRDPGGFEWFQPEQGKRILVMGFA